MKRWLIAVFVELDLIALALVGAVLCWRNSVHTTTFRPSGDVPGFTATRYAAPWQLLAAVLVAAAGLLAIDTTARLVRGIRGQVRTER
ncbi:hypothetical protein ACL02S_22445 [Nocardia sp. 004]|uniref:hypothetical protein n=1 Tax=Nocardia sp. 004 TaxID=3385978 RepID=UPI0039A2FA73